MSEAQLIIAESILESFESISSYVVRQSLRDMVDDNKVLCNENARLREAIDRIRKKSYEPDPERPALSTRAEIQLIAEAALQPTSNEPLGATPEEAR